MKAIVTTGKRRSAIARASLTSGSGRVTINGIALSAYEPALSRLRLQEPLILAEKSATKYDIKISVQGGGVSGQTDAARLALARALVEKEEKLKLVFLDYDRLLLVADVRRKEQRKPNSHGKARSKRQKSYR